MQLSLTVVQELIKLSATIRTTFNWAYNITSYRELYSYTHYWGLFCTFEIEIPFI